MLLRTRPKRPQPKKSKDITRINFLLNSNLQNYLLDFFDIDDYLNFIKINKKLRNLIKNKKSFLKLFLTLQTLIAIKEEFLQSIFYHDGSLKLFSSEEYYVHSEMTKIFQCVYSRLFLHSITINLSQMSVEGFRNLEIILKDSRINIKHLEIKLNYIHFYHFDKTMTRLLRSLKDNTTIRNLNLIDISRGHIEYFRNLLIRNSNIKSLSIKVRNDKLHNFEFDFLNKENKISELKVIGKFSEVEKKSILNLIGDKKFKNFDFSESENLVHFELLKVFEKWKCLKFLDISKYPLGIRDIKALKIIVNNNKNLKLKLIEKEQCRYKKLYSELVNKSNI